MWKCPLYECSYIGVTYIATICRVAKEQRWHITREGSSIIAGHTIPQLIVIKQFVRDLAEIGMQLEWR